jgi:phage-related protein
LFEDAAALAPPFWTIKRSHYAALSPRQLSSKTPTATAGAAYYVVDKAGQLLGEHDATGAPIYETIYLGSLPVGVMKQTGSAAPATLQSICTTCMRTTLLLRASLRDKTTQLFGAGTRQAQGRLTRYTSSYIISTMPNKDKPLEWVGSSHKDLMALPMDVRRFFGYALSLAQAGDQHDAAKVLKGFGGSGVLEVVEDDAGGTYRAVYSVKFAEAVFVLHCFQKKSKRGIATPKQDMDIIHARLRVAQALAKELRNEKTSR